METNRPDLIVTNLTALIDAIKPKMEEICNFLEEKKVMSDTMVENVMCKSTPTNRATYFFDTFSFSSHRSFGFLYEICHQLGLIGATKILYEGLNSKQKCKYFLSGQDDELPLPAKWTNKEHYNRVMEGKLEVKVVSQETNPFMYDKYQTHLQQKYTKSIYPMHHRVRGNALIFNMDHFPLVVPTLPDRKGSEPDKLGLTQLFRQLGFQVKLECNLTKEEVEAAIAREKEEDHSEHDCFVFFFLSYGSVIDGQDVVKDKRGHPIVVQDLVDSLVGLQDLKGKPKLFFFQSCRGIKIGQAVEPLPRGVEQYEYEEDEKEDEMLGTYRERHDGAEPSKGGGSRSTPVTYPDVFVYWSTSKDSYAYRNEDYGSWFTQAVIYIFAEYACRRNLSDLQLKVNELLSRANATTSPGVIGKNVSDTNFIPGPELYFFPGLYNS